MMKKKKVLIGYDDFRDLLESGGYFVDKSLLIKDLIDIDNKVTLITSEYLNRHFKKMSLC
jgi:hypothetical protein